MCFQLRCNGNPNGCDRCKSASNVCKYPTNKGGIRKRKQSNCSAKHSSEPDPSTPEGAIVPQSPAFSDHFKIDPSLVYHNPCQETGETVALRQLQHQKPLPSPELDLAQCQNDMIIDAPDNHNEKHEQDQIDQWLASCSLFSPNGTIEVSGLKSGDFGGSWQEFGKDMRYFDHLEDSGDDGTSSQETQLEDLDMNDSNDAVDHCSSTPCLSSSSLDMLLDENFSTNTSAPRSKPPTTKRSPPIRRETPSLNKAPPATAVSPLSALLETTETTYKRKSECRCLQLAAHLLEQLGNEGANTEQPTMDGLLNCCREAIKGCDSILGCTLCKSRSESMMLLAMAGQYLSNICEKTVRCYVDVVQSAQPTSCAVPGEAAMWFQSYKIESESERNQVLKCLVTGQLTEFCQLISRIKARVGTRKAHLAPLLGAERKVQCMRAMLMQCEGYRGLRSSSDSGSEMNLLA
ncbi:C6 zinc finger domain protein [Colletotrichum truncatum]|uniref:C6 zinc finger domain protein n=1 Tax=Colletotrichum truncatum TaxID=5467 RepID=A0ACC3YQG1_COLTU|nr:C6 zinc finger domain protein [Colletotrichum truncatum]KAF6789510.1 C6 zinc finger domain protein [Colletotrichum truncatum]